MTEPRPHTKQRIKTGALRPAPAIVLVEPQMGENIGAVARAMLNFGMVDLVLVNPRDGWPNEKAVAMASGAALVIERARVVATTADALAEVNYALAMTARPRESLLPSYSPRAAAAELKARTLRGEACAILLGPERAGLANDDVGRCDGVVSIPVNLAFPSLNLAQAAAVFAYEWALAGGYDAPPSDLDAAPQASKAQFEGFIDDLFAALDSARYFFPPEKREAMEKKLKTVFARAALTEGETRTLRGVVKALKGRRES